MILLIDNYDSFVWNLARYLRELGASIEVVRNDRISLDEVVAMDPTGVLLSPGPHAPDQAGVCLPLIRELGHRLPILGICLGHQAIAQAHGGRLLQVPPVHGHPWPIEHGGRSLFAGLPSPFAGTRYHSLAVDPGSLPACLEPLAWCQGPGPGRRLMALRHRVYPQVGLQFHPESIASEHGHQLLAAFLRLAHRFRQQPDWPDSSLAPPARVPAARCAGTRVPSEAQSLSQTPT